MKVKYRLDLTYEVVLYWDKLNYLFSKHIILTIITSYRIFTALGLILMLSVTIMQQKYLRF